MCNALGEKVIFNQHIIFSGEPDYVLLLVKIFIIPRYFDIDLSNTYLYRRCNQKKDFNTFYSDPC